MKSRMHVSSPEPLWSKLLSIWTYRQMHLRKIYRHLGGMVGYTAVEQSFKEHRGRRTLAPWQSVVKAEQQLLVSHHQRKLLPDSLSGLATKFPAFMNVQQQHLEQCSPNFSIVLQSPGALVKACRFLRPILD
ncbi:uncharacterized protein LOC144298368 isoform X1 [Canis aureus]